jgi:hypothetical protein
MTVTKRDIAAAKKHAENNEDEIQASDECGCFHCLEIFSKDEIEDWTETEEGRSAVCPRCDVEAVVGDASGLALTEELLDAVRQDVYG